jgi:hypothetical protein
MDLKFNAALRASLNLSLTDIAANISANSRMAVAGTDAIDQAVMAADVRFPAIETWVAARVAADLAGGTNAGRNISQISTFNRPLSEQPMIPRELHTWAIISSSGRNNSCLIHSLLTSISPTFRHLRIEDRNYIADYFRYHIFSRLINERRAMMTDNIRVQSLERILNNRPLGDEEITAFTSIFRLRVMVYQKEFATLAGAAELEPYAIFESPDAEQVWAFLINPDNVHYEAIRDESGNYLTDRTGWVFRKVKEMEGSPEQRARNAEQRRREDARNRNRAPEIALVQARLEQDVRMVNQSVIGRRLSEFDYIIRRGLTIIGPPDACSHCLVKRVGTAATSSAATSSAARAANAAAIAAARARNNAAVNAASRKNNKAVRAAAEIAASAAPDSVYLAKEPPPGYKSVLAVAGIINLPPGWRLKQIDNPEAPQRHGRFYFKHETTGVKAWILNLPISGGRRRKTRRRQTRK